MLMMIVLGEPGEHDTSSHHSVRQLVALQMTDSGNHRAHSDDMVTDPWFYPAGRHGC